MCFKGLQISTHLHRAQVEYELREKVILLRQHVLLAAGNDSRLMDVVLRSAPSFGTLFRHALIALGSDSVPGRREAVQALAKKIGGELSAVEQALDIREGKLDAKKVNANDLCSRYLGGD